MFDIIVLYRNELFRKLNYAERDIFENIKHLEIT